MGAREPGAEPSGIGPSYRRHTSAALMWVECNPTAGAGSSAARQARVKALPLARAAGGEL